MSGFGDVMGTLAWMEASDANDKAEKIKKMMQKKVLISFNNSLEETRNKVRKIFKDVWNEDISYWENNKPVIVSTGRFLFWNTQNKDKQEWIEVSKDKNKSMMKIQFDEDYINDLEALKFLNAVKENFDGEEVTIM